MTNQEIFENSRYYLKLVANDMEKVISSYEEVNKFGELLEDDWVEHLTEEQQKELVDIAEYIDELNTVLWRLM